MPVDSGEEYSQVAARFWLQDRFLNGVKDPELWELVSKELLYKLIYESSLSTHYYLHKLFQRSITMRGPTAGGHRHSVGLNFRPAHARY